jgi:hypothetical protein
MRFLKPNAVERLERAIVRAVGAKSPWVKKAKVAAKKGAKSLRRSTKSAEAAELREIRYAERSGEGYHGHESVEAQTMQESRAFDVSRRRLLHGKKLKHGLGAAGSSSGVLTRAHKPMHKWSYDKAERGMSKFRDL